MGWDYTGTGVPQPYGETTTYALGMAWLHDCADVEDWGCGTCYARRFTRPGQAYAGVDSAAGTEPGVRQEDLRDYAGYARGIFMRHVLEHNVGWLRILENALVSFEQRMTLIVFTPPSSQGDQILDWTGDVPDIAISERELRYRIRRFLKADFGLRTDTKYGSERVFLLGR